MALWHLWVALGLVLLIVEALTATFLFASLALATLATAGFAYYGFSIITQLVAFAVSATIFLAVARPMVRQYLGKPDVELRDPNDALIGATGSVLDAMEPAQLGKVHLKGSIWTARNTSTDTINVGETITVTAVQGLTLSVKKNQE